MAVERIDTVWDIPAIEKEYNTYLNFLQKSQDELTALFNIIKQFKDSNITNLTQNAEKLSVSMAGTLETTKAAAAANKELVDAITALTAAMKTRTAAQSASKVKTDEEIRSTLAARDALKARTDAIKAEGSFMQQLTNKYNAQVKVAKELAAQYGVQDERAKMAAASAKTLGERISEINKSTGNSAPNTGVGRYAEGIREFAKEALAAGAAAVGIHSLVDFISEGVKEFGQSQLAGIKLSNILSNLGRQDALADLNKEAAELSETFKTFEKSDVQDVFQKLITFGHLTKNQILELTPVIIDFAAKSQISLSDATSIITRSLEGNGRALKEYGINIKDGGTITEKFGQIMTELKPRVDGFAKAMGEEGIAGQAKKAEVEISELKQQVGEEFGPALLAVEKGALQGLKGLPLLFNSITYSIEAMINTAKVGTLYLLQLASFGNFKGFDRFKAQIDAQNKLNESNAMYRHSLEAGDAYAKDARKNSIEDQERELHIQEMILKTQLEQYQLDQKNGVVDKNRKQGLLNDIAIVNALRKSIADQKDTRILGVSGDDGGKDKKALDDIKDYSDGFKSILENIVEFNNKSLNIDTTPLQKDLNEAFATYGKFFGQIVDLREKDQKDVDKYANDVAAKLKKKEITPEEAIKGMEQVRAARKQITDKSNEDLLQAENAYQVNVAAIQDKYRKEAEKKRQEQADKDFAEGMANAKRLYEETQKTAEGNLNDSLANAKSGQLDNDNLKNKKAVIKAQYNYDLQQLYDAHANGLKSEAVYQEELKALKKKYHDDSDAADKSSLDKAIDQVQKYVGDAEKLIGGIVELRKTTELNALQEIEDAQNRNYAAQVKRINSSTTSEENKAARLKQLDAERQIQDDQNEQKKRQIQQQSARFQKAESIFSIILNTAKGVSAAIPNPILIALAAATGLAELAIAAATPIPQYGFGTEDHPGGLAVLGDRYKKEVVKEPGKKPYLSPAVPTVMNLAQHTKVIPIDQIEQIRQGSMMVNPYGQLVGMKDNDVVKEIREMKQAFIWSVMENKKNNSRGRGKTPPVKVDLKWEYYIYKAVKS